MPRATLPGVGNKSLPDQRTAKPHSVRNNAAIPTGRTIRHSNESASQIRLCVVADVDLCPMAASLPTLFILLWFPCVGLHRAIIGHKGRIGVIFKVSGAGQNSGCAAERFNLLK